MIPNFSVKAIKLKRIVVPGDDIFGVVDSIKKISDGSVVAISSKVVSLCEGSFKKNSNPKSRDNFIIRQAEIYIPRVFVPDERGIITVNKKNLVFSSGIDEYDGLLVFWPANPERSAKRIHDYLKRKHKLRKLGVIICDSRTTPLRRGSLGFVLGFWGISPLNFYRGKKALSGRVMKSTVSNVADALASAAVFAMGEGGERTPIAVITGNLPIQFLSGVYWPKSPDDNFFVDPKKDNYSPLFVGKFWKKNRPV